MAVTQLRRNLSIAAVRSKAVCMLACMLQVGPGANINMKQRQWQVFEEKMHKERIAHFMARVRGAQVIRRGRFMEQ